MNVGKHVFNNQKVALPRFMDVVSELSGERFQGEIVYSGAKS